MFETNYTEEMSEKINRYMYLILIDLISKYNKGEYLELEPVNKDIAENVLEKLNEFNNEEQYLTSTTYLL